MTHYSSIPALAADLEALSKMTGQLAKDLRDALTQETATNSTTIIQKESLKPQKKVTQTSAELQEAQVPEVTQELAPATSTVPSGAEFSAASDPVVTIEQVRAVLAEKSQAGLTGKVKNLLEQFGAAKLSGVNPADYEKLITAAKALS